MHYKANFFRIKFPDETKKELLQLSKLVLTRSICISFFLTENNESTNNFRKICNNPNLSFA